MFRAIKNNYKKSEAAIVVQNLLELQAQKGLFSMNTGESANDLVRIVWDRTPHLFDGSFGQRPHKLSLAAAAFGNSLRILGVDNRNAQVFALCLAVILQELTVNRSLYPLNNSDHQILTQVASDLNRFQEAFSESPMGCEVNQILGELDKD